MLLPPLLRLLRLLGTIGAGARVARAQLKLVGQRRRRQRDAALSKNALSEACDSLSEAVTGRLVRRHTTARFAQSVLPVVDQRAHPCNSVVAAATATLRVCCGAARID